MPAHRITSACPTSLPLMGIGKHIKYLGALAVVAALSLPLMGIGNVLSTGSKSRTHVSSLPLMGIGNPDGPRPRRTSRRPSHYPSWGSERRQDRRPSKMRSTNSKPHYPSWGSETVLRGLPRRAVNGAHYPSWGSETSARARPGCLGCSAPHYPSWGSETSPTLTNGHPATWLSLPLMGIGNYGGPMKRCTVCKRNSLPLRGSETSEAAAGRRGGNVLITPHGDRKPRHPCAGSSRTPPLITWGGNTSRRRSLPLMGIGNLYLGQRRQQRHRHLITPHGDRKLLPRRAVPVACRTSHYPS